MLSYYAERLAAVEINNTFYRMPSAQLLRDWAAQVPAGFTFVLKAPQQITHRKRLKDAAEPLSYFLQSAAALGDKQGPILFQLPPNLRLDLDRLTAFLELIPRGTRAAFEFRHASWHDQTVFAALHAHDAALCIAETEEEATPLVPTAGWGYLRLRRQDYDDAMLSEWAARLVAQPWDEAFVFFKHEDEAAGPRLAQRFLELVPA